MSADPAAVPMAELVQRVDAFVRRYMNQYDASHNYEHIQRVLGLARLLEAAERRAHPDAALDSDIITLASLLHDVGDRKYLKPGQDASQMAADALRQCGAPPALADYVQTIVLHVSFTKERAHPAAVQAVLPTHPELRIVQDADRLDALGAHGVGRIFTFNAAQGAPSMRVAYDHIDYKLLDRQLLMKTAAGLAMARVRCERLRQFQEWWTEEEADVQRAEAAPTAPPMASSRATDAEQLLNGHAE